MKFLRYLSLVAVLLSPCMTKSVEYIKDSRDYVSEGIDSHDVELAIKESVKNFELEFLGVDKNFKSSKEKKIFTISRIENKTKENVDTEIIARQLMREIRKSKNGKKIEITNAISGESSGKDSAIDEVRKLRDNREFNQESVIKKGGLVAPNYSLSGKINQKISKLPDDKKRIDYIFSWSVVDLRDGTLEWDFDYTISKVSDHNSKQIVALKDTKDLKLRENEYKKQENEVEENFGMPFDDDDDVEAHLVIGTDLTFFESYKIAHNLENVNLLSTLKIGTMIDFKYVSLNINALLNVGAMQFPSDSKNAKVFIPKLGKRESRLKNNIITLTGTRVGGELNINFLKYLYIGGGALFDVNTSYTTSTNPFKEIELHSQYPFAKAGIMINPRDFNFVLNFGAMSLWNRKDYTGTYFNFSVMIKI